MKDQGQYRHDRDGRAAGAARIRALVTVVALLVLPSIVPSTASARSHATVVVDAPSVAFVRSTVLIEGRVAGTPTSLRVVSQARLAGRWRNVAASRLRRGSHGTFSLKLRAPARPGTLVVRVEAVQGSRVLAVSRSARVRVDLRPLLIPAQDVVSVPPPGKPGLVVLHARLPGARTARATAASTCPTLPGPPQFGQAKVIPYSPAMPYGSLTKQVSFVSVQLPCTISFQTAPATLEDLVGNSGASINYSSLKDVSTGASVAAGTSFSQPNLVSFSVTGSASASLSASVKGTAKCALPQDTPLLAPFDFATFKGTIGGWPIVVTLRGLVDANASISASADTTTGITAKESITGGLGYGKPSGNCAGRASGGFYPIWCGPTSSPFTFTPPTVTATANATATISPAVQALLYGVAGPQLTLTTGLDFTATTTSNPWWTLTAPIDIEASLTAPTLGLKSGNLPLYHPSDFCVAHAGGPFADTSAVAGCAPSVQVTNPGTQTGTVGTPARLQIRANDSDGGALSYSATGLPSNLSINSTSGLITGTPRTASTAGVTVTATDSTGPSGTASFTWAISPAGATIEDTPNPPGTNFLSRLIGVSCASASDCLSVGFYDPNQTTSGGGLAETWDGTSWTLQPAPSGQLIGVSCPAPSACMAVGDSGAEAWNGTAFTSEPTPSPGGSLQSRLNSVSCMSVASCDAVGWYQDSAGNVETLAETWDGMSWAIQTTPNPPETNSMPMLNSVSCSSPTNCTAVGSYSNAGNQAMLVEQWNGTSWSIQATPTVAGGSTSELEGVSCTSAAMCIAVGSEANGTAELALLWNGVTWSIMSTPTSGTARLFGVSCTSAMACTTVGDDSSGTHAERWDGTAWAIVPSANRPGEQDSLYGVSCTSDTSCTAVGDNGPPADATLAEQIS
jgi:hypothetical protein